jgi:isopentenyl diphosphate isomerase/L-lactate dehydrogenase-like FMN-dependent dehydrogenase
VTTAEYTLHRSRSALDRIEFLPNQSREVNSIDTTTAVLGQRVPLPIVLSPVG